MAFHADEEGRHAWKTARLTAFLTGQIPVLEQETTIHRIFSKRMFEP